MFKLNPNPTFHTETRITVPGRDAAVLKVEWRHQGRKALGAWIESAPGTGDSEALEKVIVSWSDVIDEHGLQVSYSRSTLSDLLDAYPAATGELLSAYVNALTESRLGN